MVLSESLKFYKPFGLIHAFAFTFALHIFAIQVHFKKML